MNKINTNKTFGFMIILLALLMPNFFLPFTTRLYEFNKLALLVVICVLSLIMVIIKMLQDKELTFIKSVLDMPAFLVIVTVTLSTIFSINKDSSIFGNYGRWFPSMLGIGILYLMYNIINTNKIMVKSVLNALLAGITISSLVTTLSYFNIYVGSASYLHTSNFTPTGSVTTAAIIAALGAIISFSSLIHENKLINKLLLTTSLIINFFLALIIGILPSWAVLGTGALAILLSTNSSDIKRNRIYFGMVVGTLFALATLVFLPATRKLVINENYLKEISLSAKASWRVTSSTVQDYPLLATGPSTFYLNFPRYRPISLNSSEVWDFSFDKPYNEVFDIMGTTGIIGLLVTGFLAYKVFSIAFFSIKKHEVGNQVRVIGIAVLSILPIFLFTYATVLNTFILTILVALLVNAYATDGKKEIATSIKLNLSTIAPITTIGHDGVISKEYLHYLVAAPMIALVAYLSFITYKIYAAEVYMRRSMIATSTNDGLGTFNNQVKAIKLNPLRDVYQSAFAQTNLALADSISSRPELTDTDKQTIQQLVAQSISSIRNVTEVVNPLNASNWIIRANIYKTISPMADDALKWAASSLSTAVQLNPTDPRLRLDLGGIYYGQEDYLTAANHYKQAIDLKNDYANAHFNFAQALIKLNDTVNAKRSLEIAKTLVEKDSADYKLVEEQLATLPENPETKPTVEELESAVHQENTPAGNQDPLTTVGDEE